MGKILSLASLTPERPSFEGNTGTFSFALPEDDNVVKDSIRYRLHSELDEIGEQRKELSNAGNVELSESWLDTLRQLTATYFTYVNEEEINSWSQYHCFSIIEWWRDNLDPTKVETATE